MQIDFHHGVTYVLARLAEFSPAEADIVAHSAQYVDDATNAGIVEFSNGASWERIASAHRTLDYRNFDSLADKHVWIPFHFLPGNRDQPAKTPNPELTGDDFVERLICRPDSPPAQDMVRAAIVQQVHRPYALHRLGITMHVYADTWAHQGFVGFIDRVNRASEIQDHRGAPDTNLIDRLKDFFGNQVDQVTGELVADVLPLGHGAVLSNPDRPYLRWAYTDGNGIRVDRNNPRDFLVAARQMFVAMRRYRLKDPDADVSADLRAKAADLSRIGSMLENIDDDDGDARHRRWLDAVANGHFSFGAEDAAYVAKGEYSWKYVAIGEGGDDDSGAPDAGYPYHAAFLYSDWKLFHDALQVHLRFVLTDLLPHYGLVAV